MCDGGLTLYVDELFGDFDLSSVQTVIVGGVALGFRDGDHHVLLLLPEHLLGGDGPLQVVLLKTQARGRIGNWTWTCLHPQHLY